jgi:hypothetical protein
MFPPKLCQSAYFVASHKFIHLPFIFPFADSVSLSRWFPAPSLRFLDPRNTDDNNVDRLASTLSAGAGAITVAPGEH